MGCGSYWGRYIVHGRRDPRLMVLKSVFNHSVVFKFLYIFRVFVFLNFLPLAPTSIALKILDNECK